MFSSLSYAASDNSRARRSENHTCQHTAQTSISQCSNTTRHHPPAPYAPSPCPLPLLQASDTIPLPPVPLPSALDITPSPPQYHYHQLQSLSSDTLHLQKEHYNYSPKCHCGSIPSFCQLHSNITRSISASYVECIIYKSGIYKSVSKIALILLDLCWYGVL